MGNNEIREGGAEEIISLRNDLIRRQEKSICDTKGWRWGHLRASRHELRASQEPPVEELLP